MSAKKNAKRRKIARLLININVKNSKDRSVGMFGKINVREKIEEKEAAEDLIG